jgi:hypothetical protein
MPTQYSLLLLLYLLAGHALCDFPWQNDFLAREKNQTIGTIWPACLFAHALIHAGMVAWLTGLWWLGTAELVIHAAVDYNKSAGRLTFNIDQAIHYACKVAWWAIATHWLSIHLWHG